MTVFAALGFRYRFGIVVLVTAAAWLATYLSTSELGTDAPVVFFPLAVICSAYMAGPIAGLLATFLGSIVAAYFFLPPEGIGVNELADQIRLIVFVFLGGGISLLAEALQRSRQRAQAKSLALAESEDRMLMAAEAAGVGTWYWGFGADVFIWSDNAFALLGLRQRQVTQGGFLAAVHPDDRAMVKNVLDAAKSGQIGDDTEFRILKPDGSMHWVLVKGRVLHDDLGGVVGMHGVMMDITSRKQVLQELRELNNTLERRVAERTLVAQKRAEQIKALAQELTQAELRERRRLAEVLHDHLQQLLVGARLNTNILQGQLHDPSTLTSVQQIDDLILQSIEVTRNLTVELSPPILHKQGLVASLRWLATWMREKHGLQVDIRVLGQDGSLAEQSSTLLFQSVRELLFNIVKHAKARTAEVVVDISVDGCVQVNVRDAGVGFDPHRTEKSKRLSGGFGLTSIRERLELLDGQFDLQSAPGQGTCVTLRVPSPPIAGQQPSGAAASQPS